MIRTIADRLRFIAKTVVKRVKQMTRPANGSGTSNLVMDPYGQKTSCTIDFSRVKSPFVDGTTVAATRGRQLPCRTRQNAI